VEVPGDATGELDDVALDRALEGARLLSINGASNVLGTVPDIAALARRAHAAGALVLLDAAQLAGHVPFAVDAADLDLLAITGHKALLGPQGTGALWVHPRVDVAPLLTGGTGGDSLQADMPDSYPDHLEAGTLNGPGIAGLAAGVDLLRHESVARIHERLAALKATLRSGLAAIPGVRVLSPAAPGGVPIVTIAAGGMDPASLALHLDREYGVLARSGLHCAPGVHRLLGTAATGALRFSLGIANQEDDVHHAIRAVAAVLARERVA
jgi:selenocysteine lyase/cysteine desulfurase